MLIVSQDKTSVVVLSQIGQMYCDSSFDSFDKYTHIYADFPDGRTCKLGWFNNNEQAEKVIKELIDAYEAINKAEFNGCENESYVSHIFYMPYD